MILGVVEAAKRKKGAKPPPRLQLAWWCIQYNALPGRGGLLDQDYRELYLNSALINIYEAVTAWRTHGGARMSPEAQQIINWLVKTGMMNRVSNG